MRRRGAGAAGRLTDDLERQRRELAAAQQRLLNQVHQGNRPGTSGRTRKRSWPGRRPACRRCKAERTAAEREAADQGKDVQTAALSLPEIRSRVQLVHVEIDALQKTPPPPQHALRYKTPVSQPLQTEELFFECRGGHVTVIDVGAMLEQLHRERDAKAKQLATQWEVDGLTDPVGAFRMHYTLEREAGPVDGAAAPAAETQFSYNISWMVEPVADVRGEAEEAALVPSSDFRKVVDALDPKVTAVTFWIYSDSYPLYRRLHDYLHDRDFVVAGRPLMEGMPIGSSPRHGLAASSR